jgi:hypothetical protein
MPLPEKIVRYYNSIIHCFISVFVSFLFIWVIGYFFCNSLPSYKFDTILNKYIYEPGTVYKHRTEGNATTLKGMYGINGIEDITKVRGQKVIIWGDSYVEAHQVSDNNKMPQVVTSLLRSNSVDGMISFGVGMSGDSVADYYHDMPKYETLATNVIAHFILISDIKDLLPDQETDKARAVFKSNPYRIMYNNWRPKYQDVKRILNSLGLYFVWEPVKAFSSVNSVNFAPRTRSRIVTHEPFIQKFENDNFTESISFLLKKLRAQTASPIIIVYCPKVPIIREEWVSYKDPDLRFVNKLSSEASINNIAFVNLTRILIENFNETGNFSRGFVNAKPGYGHFNENGHRIIAKGIADYIQRYIIN